MSWQKLKKKQYLSERKSINLVVFFLHICISSTDLGISRRKGNIPFAGFKLTLTSLSLGWAEKPILRGQKYQNLQWSPIPMLSTLDLA